MSNILPQPKLLNVADLRNSINNKLEYLCQEMDCDFVNNDHSFLRVDGSVISNLHNVGNTLSYAGIQQLTENLGLRNKIVKRTSRSYAAVTAAPRPFLRRARQSDYATTRSNVSTVTTAHREFVKQSHQSQVPTNSDAKHFLRQSHQSQVPATGTRSDVYTVNTAPQQSLRPGSLRFRIVYHQSELYH